MKKLLPFLFLFLTCFLCYPQGRFVLQNNKDSDKIRFKLLNNLIVIPVEINGAELTFLLDSGVRKPIIFNLLNVTDSLLMNETETIFAINKYDQGENATNEWTCMGFNSTSHNLSGWEINSTDTLFNNLVYKDFDLSNSSIDNERDQFNGSLILGSRIRGQKYNFCYTFSSFPQNICPQTE